MLFLILRIYQYVIHEYNKKLVQIRMQQTIHQTHKGTWSISQTEWNYNKIIMPVPSPKICLVNVLFLDVYLMIYGSQINLREHFFSLQLIKQVINPQQRVLVLNNHLIQLPVINA